MMKKGISAVRKDGIVQAAYRVLMHLRMKQLYKSTFNSISQSFSKPQETTEGEQILISVVVPIYNTPVNFLQEMVESVVNQTYSNWELCLVDASDLEHNYIEKIVSQYSLNDRRIIYKKLDRNMGISENTNACIKLAYGQYIALLDHDDLLHPDALKKVSEAINEQGADFIYTDELTFMDNINNIVNIHFKPDFGVYTLRGNNYICHLTVFSKHLFGECGGFRKEYDGSQDYDIILRLTENARKIVHIHQVLYFWRSHSGSVASSIGAKPYAVFAAQKSLESHLKRCGLKGTVEPVNGLSSVFNIKYEIDGFPLISILIINHNTKRLIYSIESIAESTYKNYEIIIIDYKNNEAYEFLDEYKGKCDIKVLYCKDIIGDPELYNCGTIQAKGDYLIFASDASIIISDDWIEALLMHAQRADVGIVGAAIYFKNNTVKHGGYNLYNDGIRGISQYRFPLSSPGYMGKMCYSRNVSAVSSDAMMISKQLFSSVQMFDPDMKTYYGLDLCQKVRMLEKSIIFSPLAKVYNDLPLDKFIFEKKPDVEYNRFVKKWKHFLEKGDPFYNKNLLSSNKAIYRNL